MQHENKKSAWRVAVLAAVLVLLVGALLAVGVFADTDADIVRECREKTETALAEGTEPFAIAKVNGVKTIIPVTQKKFDGATLCLDGEIAMKFVVYRENLPGVLTVGIKDGTGEYLTAEVEKDDKTFTVTVRGIKAYDLGTVREYYLSCAYANEVYDATVGVTYSPVIYAQNMYAKSSTANDLKQLLTDFVNYAKMAGVKEKKNTEGYPVLGTVSVYTDEGIPETDIGDLNDYIRMGAALSENIKFVAEEQDTTLSRAVVDICCDEYLYTFEEGAAVLDFLNAGDLVNPFTLKLYTRDGGKEKLVAQGSFSLAGYLASVRGDSWNYTKAERNLAEAAAIYLRSAGLYFHTIRTESGETLHGTDIRSKAMARTEDTFTLTVSNAMETFSFDEDLTVAEGATYSIGNKQGGLILPHNVPLAAGDNTFYIHVTNGNDSRQYTVTIRRRPLYTVNFYTNGGSYVPSQTVEEDGYAEEPDMIPTRAGYDFVAWDFDFTTPITGYTDVYATWQARNDTPYQVKYYLQNVTGSGYTLDETKNLTGTTDTTVTAEDKVYPHFTRKTQNLSANLKGDGTLVIDVYYDREVYTVTFDANGGTRTGGGALTQYILYGADATAPTLALFGYSYEYDKAFTNVQEDLTVTAGWELVTYRISYQLNYGTFDLTGYPTTFTIKDRFSFNGVPEKAGFRFLGWYDGNTKITKLDGSIARDIILTVKWEAFFTWSGNTVTGLTETGKAFADIVIPESIDGRSITGIAANAFKGNKAMITVSIPPSVTSIGDDAFSYCTGLTSVTIPSSVTSIGSYAFCGCTGLTSVTIPSSVTSIGSYAFQDCTGLTGVYITDLAKWCGISFGFGRANPLCYAHNLYLNGELVKDLVIPQGVTSIGSSVFSHCTGLTSVTIPQGVTSIGDSAFSHCTGLTSVTIPQGVTSIGSFAFSGCKKLTIYCAAASKPSGWDSNWNRDNRPVVWNYKG